MRQACKSFSVCAATTKIYLVCFESSGRGSGPFFPQSALSLGSVGERNARSMQHKERRVCGIRWIHVYSGFLFWACK